MWLVYVKTVVLDFWLVHVRTLLICASCACFSCYVYDLYKFEIVLVVLGTG